MKQPRVKGTDLRRRDPLPWVTKLALVFVFLLGAALTWMGIRGQETYNRSGFSSEAGFQAVHALADAVGEQWNQALRPALNSLTEEERAAAEENASLLLRDAWEKQVSGGGALAEDAVREADASGRSSFPLLYTTYLVSGPKISPSGRKAVTALTGTEAAAFRQELLRCVADPERPVPDPAAELTADLEGTEKQAVLTQALFVSCGSSGENITASVNAFKKSVRDKTRQLEAFQTIAKGETSGLWNWIVSHSRTAVLLGIICMLDVVLLALLMAADRRWEMNIKWFLVLIILDFLLLFQLLPMIIIMVRSVFPDGSFTLATFRRLYEYPLNLEALKNTLIASFATMVLGTAIAFPLAWLVGRTNLYGRKFFRALFVLSYMVPPYVGAMAWQKLMNPNAGLINQWLRTLLGLADMPGPLNVHTLPGLIWVLTGFYYPYAFITISRAMEKMDPSLEEASRISGARPVKTVLRITLPMMTPSLIAGALLVFISAASCYGIPSIVGIPGNVNTVTTRIVEYVGQGAQGVNDAVGLSVFLMIVALIVLFISDVVLAKRQYITVSGKSVQPAVVDLRRGRVPLTVLVSLFAVFMVLLPFGVILVTSFKIDLGASLTAPGNFTLDNWTSVFARSETLGCLKNSLLFAAAAATVGLVIACVMSYLLQRTRIRGRGIPNFLITLGSGTPSVVIALGLIMTMRGNFGINIYNTAWILIIAYLVKYLMMGMRTVVSAMSQIHVSLEECSQACGAGWFRTMRKITGPLILPSIAAGWFLIFIPSFYELSMTTLLYSATTKTIGFQLYEYWTFTSQPMSCAMAFGILLIVVFLNFILNRLTKGEFSI